MGYAACARIGSLVAAQSRYTATKMANNTTNPPRPDEGRGYSTTTGTRVSPAERSLYGRQAPRWSAFSEDVWRRSFDVNADFVKRMSKTILDGFSQRPHVLDFAQALSGNCLNYAANMAMVYPLAAHKLTEDASQAKHQFYMLSSRERRVPFALPARVLDAKQGQAVYLVDRENAMQWLDDVEDSEAENGLPSAHFALFAPRPAKALLVLTAVDYAVSDFGCYTELGAALVVTHKHTPYAPPGLFIKTLLVPHTYTLDAGHQIWGYPKQLDADMFFDTSASAYVTFSVRGDDKGNDVLRLIFPRAGTASSSRVPIVTYTMKYDCGSCSPVKTVFVRSARGERINAGQGEFKLEIDSANGRAQPPYFTGQNAQTLIDRLRTLGVETQSPIGSSFAEHMQGDFGIPCVL